MITVILAGGKGSRLGSITKKIPKPMVKISNVPILVHVMKIYQQYSYNKFLICTGYLHKEIESYFDANATSKKIITINKKKHIEYFSQKKGWSVILNFTGKNSMTGERLNRCKKIIKYFEQENFFFTYGDGVGSVNIKKLLISHLKSNKIATVTAVKPPPRFGALTIKKNDVTNFSEKKVKENTWINGGFFVLNQKVFNFISGTNPVWEQKPLEKLAKKKQLNAFKHESFWQPMDTVKDKEELTKLFNKHRDFSYIKCEY